MDIYSDTASVLVFGAPVVLALFLGWSAIRQIHSQRRSYLLSGGIVAAMAVFSIITIDQAFKFDSGRHKVDLTQVDDRIAANVEDFSSRVAQMLQKIGYRKEASRKVVSRLVADARSHKGALDDIGPAIVETASICKSSNEAQNGIREIMRTLASEKPRTKN